MNEEGQAYFASDKEVSQEDAIRYKEAEMEIERARADFEELAERAARTEAEADEFAEAQEDCGPKGPPSQQGSIDPLSMVGEFDAYRWADFWLQTLAEYPDIATDRDTMMGWFANAIMAGYDHHRNNHACE